MAEAGWQPIETVPKGRSVLCFSPDAREPCVFIAELNDFINPNDASDVCTDWTDTWLEDALDVEPTHWMPLPAPPEPSK